MDYSAVQMGLGDFLFYSVFGICLVFVVLTCLIVVIKVLLAVTDAAAKKEEAAAPAAAPAAPVERPLAPGTAGDLKLYDTDPRSAAMIMAIVADELGKPLNELRFISIKEVK